mmetsp:Transcript_22534/g.53127  ORF Transcript_22534/g.53127 Transcript_22534/m.53127 type:complete len:483 (+) Transcript_22534:64-1512(+)
MKVQTLKRTAGASVERECAGDLRRSSRNLNPQHHPMQRAREYQRAVTAAKMERMFAKPFVGDLQGGHRDAVTCTATSRKALLPLVSGAADGCVALWDLATRKRLTELAAHTRAVTAVEFCLDGQAFYSGSDDGLVHRWTVHPNNTNNNSNDMTDQSTRSRKASRSSLSSTTTAETSSSHVPVATFRCNGGFKSISQSWTDVNRFATASDDAVQIWTPERTHALQTHSDLFGSQDTVSTVRWHPVEGHLLAHCSVDRGIGLHDIRASQALKKTVLRMRCNDLQWNPMEPMNFAVANEDYNAYLFDMRKLDAPLRLYQGHTSAVLSLAWSPTGREFATASYDKTVRIFPLQQGTAREIYHTKRMQRVQTVEWTADNKYIVTGSDDSNLRLWKAVASEQIGQLNRAEAQAQDYRAALVKRYQHLPQVKQIVKSRKIPRAIRNLTQQARLQKESADRKQGNRVKYDKQGKYEFTPERKKVVVKQVE